MITKLAQLFLPKNLAQNPGSEDYWRMLLCAFALAMTAFFSVCSIVLYAFVLQTPQLAILSSVILVVVAVQLVLVRVVGSLRLSAFIFAVAHNLLMFGAAYFLGGISSLVTAGFFGSPLIALILLGKRTMVLMLILTVLELILLIILASLNITSQVPFSQEVAPFINGFISLSLLFAILGTFYYFDVVRSLAYQLLSEERDTFQLRVQEATNNLEIQNTALQQALQDIEKVNVIKDEFLRNISHEVRTPISNILGFAEILAERLKDNNDDMLFARQISLAGNSLLAIFTNVLQLSRIEAEDIVKEMSLVDIDYLLEPLKRKITKLAELKGLEFSILLSQEIPKYIILDSNHARDILAYLGENAVKFTEHGSVRIALHLHHSQQATRHQTYLICEVIDTGIGISQEFMPKIYTPFHQQDGSKNRAFGGLGLSLAIAKKMLDAIDGTISVESTVGQGTIFTVKIPCEVASDAAHKGTV